MRNFLGRLADRTSVDLRWLGGRTWGQVAFGLPPVAGRTNRLKITRVVLAALAQWFDVVDVVFLQLALECTLAVWVGAVPILLDGDFSAFWFGELFAFGGLLSLGCVKPLDQLDNLLILCSEQFLHLFLLLSELLLQLLLLLSQLLILHLQPLFQ